MNGTLLFSDDENDDYLTENNLLNAPKDEAKRENEYDELLFQRLKTSLSGVPPPPALTQPQQKVEEILEIWKKFSQVADSEEKIVTNGSNTLRMNCSLEKAIESKWPEAKCCYFFDISYNLGEFSEKIVDLYEKYRERYVGCETSSFVSANSPIKDYLTKKKDRRKIIGCSPGRRLSYLARRRSAFSSESLRAASNAKTFGVERKTILVDANKDKKNKVVKRALFHTPDEIKTKTDVKSSTSKLKSVQLRHSLWLRKRTPKKGTPRKTPHKLTPKKLTPNKRSTPRKRDTPNKKPAPECHSQDIKIFTDKAYQTSISENGKKLRLDLPPNESTNVGSTDSKSDGSISDLSDTQRKKLLWAVSAALKKVGVNCTHKNFKEYGKRLYHICKTFWTSKVSNKTLKSGISERMLYLASEHVNNVIEEVQRARIENIDLFNQDSNSCDVFFANSDNIST